MAKGDSGCQVGETREPLCATDKETGKKWNILGDEAKWEPEKRERFSS